MTPDKQLIFADELSKTLAIQSPSPEQLVHPDWLDSSRYQLTVKRDELLHPVISGNKWRKLKYSLLSALRHHTTHLISFGGGYSNHLHALAYCCHQLGLRFTAIVRGDYRDNPSPTLLDLQRWKTDIQYVNKQTYRQRNEQHYLAQLQQNFPAALIIPEGGSSLFALQGLADIIDELQQHYDYILAPVASGGTLAGLVKATHHLPLSVLGIAVLKGEGYLESLVTELLPREYSHWSICHDFHAGGYAKSSVELTSFCEQFAQQTAVTVEPVYSGKMFFALKNLCLTGYFPAGSRILALHTGGLQGRRASG